VAFTFFFRDRPILETAAAMLAEETMGRIKVRIWDAGCAMGPEPYTFTIMLAECMGKFAFGTVTVDATDYEEHGDFGSIIRSGRYPHDSLCRIPPELFNKYFTAVDGEEGMHEIRNDIKNRVRFIHHDLLTFTAPGEGYSMVICKNVLLHFTEEERLKVLAMFYGSLAENGILVLEQTQRMPDAFTERFEKVVPDAQIYRKKAVVPALVA